MSAMFCVTTTGSKGKHCRNVLGCVLGWKKLDTKLVLKYFYFPIFSKRKTRFEVRIFINLNSSVMISSLTSINTFHALQYQWNGKTQYEDLIIFCQNLIGL